jgi:hypothetical protein
MSEPSLIDRWIEAMAALHGLPLDETSIAEIRANLAVAQRMATLLAEFPLDEREEQLPVYRP